MDDRILRERDDLEAFRAAIRSWLAEVLPHDIEDRLAQADDAGSVEIQRWWMAERNKVGLGTPDWPEEYGGADLTLAQQIVLADENARANVPIIPAFQVSLTHIPATLMSWGTVEQKRRYLPGVAQGEIWCQGFSEPGAGSDLASLSTKAEKRGDHYLINGTKLWSSFAAYAQRCILLVRTDRAAVKKHDGISFFIMDMDSPGVETRPLRMINGGAAFAEITLTDVKIPAENLVGPENQGWQVAQTTLASERGVLAFEYGERQRYELEDYFAGALRDGAAWLHDDACRREFIERVAQLQVHRRMLRHLLRGNEADQKGGLLPAYIKLHGATNRQRLTSLMTRIAALECQMFTPGYEQGLAPPMYGFLTCFGWTIAGGSSEIMRNMIAERGLGMPRD